MENEKLKIWLGFWKFILGTVALGIISAILNWQYQNKQLEQEKVRQESDFVAQFLNNALDKDLEKRRDFAEYFFRVSPTADARERWKKYQEYITSQMSSANKYQDEIESLKHQIAKIKTNSQKNDSNKTQILNDLTKKLEIKQRDLASIRSENFEMEQSYLELKYINQHIKKYGEKDAAKLLFTSKFDRDGSGLIDKERELNSITCRDWEMSDNFLPYRGRYEKGVPINVWAEYLGIDSSLMYQAMDAQNKCSTKTNKP